MKNTWEKVLEYASMPVHGTLSRKLRKGVSLQINNGEQYKEAVIFLGEEFVRITAEDKNGNTNVYYDWTGITTIRTCSPKNGK